MGPDCFWESEEHIVAELNRPVPWDLQRDKLNKGLNMSRYLILITPNSAVQCITLSHITAHSPQCSAVQCITQRVVNALNAALIHITADFYVSTVL